MRSATQALGAKALVVVRKKRAAAFEAPGKHQAPVTTIDRQAAREKAAREAEAEQWIAQVRARKAGARG